MSKITIGGKTRSVKNLGWLRRNWQKVDSFTLVSGKGVAHGPGKMIAYLRGGGQYEMDWASESSMREWLDRPVFRGLPIKVVEVVTPAQPPTGGHTHKFECFDTTGKLYCGF